MTEEMAKIVSLRAENIKRLRAVEITPAGHLVEITGRNGQGKTSVLDSIEMALAGKRSIPTRPIRDGAEEALLSGKVSSGNSLTAGHDVRPGFVEQNRCPLGGDPDMIEAELGG